MHVHDIGRRRGRTGRTAAAVAAVTALCLAAFGTPARAAATNVPPITVAFVAGTGSLYGVERTTNGQWSAPVDLATGLTSAGAPVAVARLSDGQSAIATVDSGGGVDLICPESPGIGPAQIAGPGTQPQGSWVALVQAGPQLVVDLVDPVGSAAGEKVAEVINPCTVHSVVVPASVRPTPPPQPGAEVALAAMPNGDWGTFFVDSGGTVQSVWQSAASGAVTESAVTGAGFAPPGSPVAAASALESGSAGTIGLAFTRTTGQIYLARQHDGGGFVAPPAPVLTSSTTQPVPGGSVSLSGNEADGYVVGYVASNGTVAAAVLDPAGDTYNHGPLTNPGFAAAGSSVSIAQIADGDDLFCGSPRIFVIHFPHAGPVSQVGSASITVTQLAPSLTLGAGTVIAGG